jgi:hypothetical protein
MGRPSEFKLEASSAVEYPNCDRNRGGVCPLSVSKVSSMAEHTTQSGNKRTHTHTYTPLPSNTGGDYLGDVVSDISIRARCANT